MFRALFDLLQRTSSVRVIGNWLLITDYYSLFEWVY
jgi:hypothetical protein